MKELATIIYKFLEKYAKIRPDFDPEFDDDNEKYTSPDASILRYCADVLNECKVPNMSYSSWESGGYAPYNSHEGRIEHDCIISDIRNIMKK